MDTEDIVIADRFMTDGQIEQLLSQMQKVPLKEAMVSDGDEPRVDYEYRICKCCKVPQEDEFKWIYELITQKVRQVNHEHWQFPIKEELTEIEYVEYDAETGSHFEWHTDSLDEGPKSKRRISVVIQLSEPDQYQGGELQAKLEGDEILTLPKEKGTTVLFTSEPTEHRVKALKKGNRSSLVSWSSI